ncbi:hypothetical protein ES703_83905 [subsurface metagenome]
MKRHAEGTRGGLITTWWDIQLRFAELVMRCLWFIETWWEQRKRDKA